MKSIKEFREFINNWALPINTNFFDLDTNNQEILENNNFSKALSNVFERFKDDGLDYEYYFKNDYNIIISFHGWNGDGFDISN